MGIPGCRVWGNDDDDDDDGGDVDDGDDDDRDRAGDDHPRNGCLDGYNRFPPERECPGFRGVVIRYFGACEAAAHRVAILMERGLLGNDRDRDDGDADDADDGDADDASFVRDLRRRHSSYLRLNYYPVYDPDTSREEGGASGAASGGDGRVVGGTTTTTTTTTTATPPTTANPPPLGISPHRDAGFLTVLLQDDDCHSLQVARYPDDEDSSTDGTAPADWVTVVPPPGSLTVNTGDMAMIWSNGAYSAPVHRVRTDPDRVRYSAPFFYNPGYDSYVVPTTANATTTPPPLPAEGKGKDRRQPQPQPQQPQPTTTTTMKYRPCLWGYYRAVRFAGDLTDLGVEEIQTSDYEIGGSGGKGRSSSSISRSSSSSSSSSSSVHKERQERFGREADFSVRFSVERYRHLLES